MCADCVCVSLVLYILHPLLVVHMSVYQCGIHGNKKYIALPHGSLLDGSLSLPLFFLPPCCHGVLL